MQLQEGPGQAQLCFLHNPSMRWDNSPTVWIHGIQRISQWCRGTGWALPALAGQGAQSERPSELSLTGGARQGRSRGNPELFLAGFTVFEYNFFSLLFPSFALLKGIIFSKRGRIPCFTTISPRLVGIKMSLQGFYIVKERRGSTDPSKTSEASP